jgi:hypothetical protein
MSQGKGLSAAITALIRAPDDHAPDSDVRLKGLTGKGYTRTIQQPSRF